jgi:type V secretory pathway adhesin AidA
MTGATPGDGGGAIQVSENNSDPAVDNITDSGDFGGTPTGVITDVLYQLNPSMRNEALSIGNDQDFYQINLFQIGNDPNFDPGLGTVDVGPDSFLTLTDFDGDTPTLPASSIEPSVTPEPASAAILGMAAMGLLSRRRRRVRRS